MNYDIGMYIEQLFKNTTARTPNYSLVFMASKERNEHSYIVSAFDKFRVQVSCYLLVEDAEKLFWVVFREFKTLPIFVKWVKVLPRVKPCILQNNLNVL